MLHVHTIGRIGKDCQVIAGAHGSFMAMNIAVDDYAKGQNVTTWVKVRSNKENHIRLAEYLTKGRLVLVEGTLSSSLWTDKNGESQIQLSITAESIAFINTGKKDSSASSPDNMAATTDSTPVPPCRYAAGRQGRPAVLTKASPVTVWTGLWYMPYPAVREIDPLPVWCMPVSVYTTGRNKNDPK